MIIDIIKNRDLDGLKKHLKSNKVDFEEKDKYGNSALNVASNLGELEITKILLEHPFDINSRGIDDCTPLYYAVSGSYTDIVKILIDKKADVNIPDEDGNTPLFIAVRGYNEAKGDSIIRLLLENGANPNIKNNYDNSIYSLLNMPKNKSIKDLFPLEWHSSCENFKSW